MMTYQQILQKEFAKRVAKNTRYSLRGFARDLNLSQSFLSQVLNQKRKLSSEKAVLIAERLRFRGATKKIFINLVRLDETQSLEAKQILQKEMASLFKTQPEFKTLPADVFNVVAGWHFSAILELTTIKGFKNDEHWIAERLGLTVSKTKQAIGTLKKLGLLEEKFGKLEKREKNYLFADVPSAAIRRHHHETLELAQKALETQPMDEREFFTVSFGMDLSKVAEAKRKIREFSESLMMEMQEHEPTSVYKFSIQLFRLDRKDVS